MGISWSSRRCRADRLSGQRLDDECSSGGLTFSARDTFIDTGTIFTGIAAHYDRRWPHARHSRRLCVESATSSTSARWHPACSLDRSRCNLSGRIPAKLGDPAPRNHRRHTARSSRRHRRCCVLGGNLDVSLIGGFMPVAGNSFTILTANVIARQLRRYRSSPAQRQDSYGTINQTLDRNHALGRRRRTSINDGVVDAADYVMWRKPDGTAAAQFDFWRSQFRQ